MNWQLEEDAESREVFLFLFCFIVCFVKCFFASQPGSTRMYLVIVGMLKLDI